MRFPSEILPIMSVDTLCFIMFVIQRTPFCLEIVHVKVGIPGHQVNQPSFYIQFSVRERTKVTIFAILRVFLGAVFCLILFYMIQSFNPVVCINAPLSSNWADFIILLLITHVRAVEVSLSPHVNIRVVVPTVFVVVLLNVRTLFKFKFIKLQVLIQDWWGGIPSGGLRIWVILSMITRVVNIEDTSWSLWRTTFRRSFLSWRFWARFFLLWWNIKFEIIILLRLSALAMSRCFFRFVKVLKIYFPDKLRFKRWRFRIFLSITLVHGFFLFGSPQLSTSWAR